jgi:hypothetical protein
MALAPILVGLLVMLALVVLDLHRRSLRTLTHQVPGGLRFEAQSFSVQVQRTEQELRVRCQRGRPTFKRRAVTGCVRGNGGGPDCQLAPGRRLWGAA